MNQPDTSEHSRTLIPANLRSHASSRVPIWILVFGMLGSFSLMFAKSRLDVRVDPDSHSYLEYDFSSLASSLQGIRTPGYPLFLKAVSQTVGIEGLGVVQWGVWCVSVICLYRGLLAVGVSRGTSTVIGLTLFFSHGVWEFSGNVGSDCLAMTLAIASVSFFFKSFQTKEVQWTTLALLATFTFATYLVRPAFLFLLVLWPTLGSWLEVVVFQRGIRRGLQRFLFMVIVSTVPWLGYSSLRYVVVGEFGLVSFEGYNLIGIGGQFVNPNNVGQLSPSVQPLARKMLEKRASVEDYRAPERFEDMVEMYNPTIWRMAVPAAEELYPNDAARINFQLQALASESIRLHRGQYLSWLLSNARYATGQIVELTLRDRGLRIMVVVLAMYVAGCWIARAFSISIPKGDEGVQPLYELQILFWLAAVYTLGKILLVILVEPALGRYVVASMLWEPCLIVSSLWHLCRKMIGTGK